MPSSTRTCPAHEQTRAIDAAAFEPVDLLEQHFGIHHNAVADDRRGARADDAGRQQVQRIRFVAHHHRVACVVAAVEPGDIIHMNIDTDTQYAFTRAVAGHMFRHYDEVLKVDGEVGNKKMYDPRSWGREAEDSMAARVVEACERLGSAGRALK